MNDNNVSRALDNVSYNAIEKATENVASRGVSLLMSVLGSSDITILSSLAVGAVVGVMSSCYDDIVRRFLSKRESEKADLLTTTAYKTFEELARCDGVCPYAVPMDESQLQYAYEAAEGLMLTAIRQSETTKVEILGRYYGREFYKGSIDWQDMHQMISMTGVLTLRQIIMIHLISTGFQGIDENQFISNPSACVEINRLKDYGIWKTEGASFGIDDSEMIQLAQLIPTAYSKMVDEALMLDRLSKEDVERTIDSLRLTDAGEKKELLTKDEYEKGVAKWGTF
ncbi:MAG: hypothetical protein IJ280_00715 [Bacteroidales bacterium]|nr:hypothetical protein [Bacteroidales bacterium]